MLPGMSGGFATRGRPRGSRGESRRAPPDEGGGTPPVDRAVVCLSTFPTAEKAAEVFVADDQLSLTIGKKGQNVRLASKLLGLRLDVRSLSQKVPLSSLGGVGPKTLENLRNAGIVSVKDILKSTPEELTKIRGIGSKTAQKIFRSAHQAILQGDKLGVPLVSEAPKETAGEDKTEGRKTEEGLEDAGS